METGSLPVPNIFLFEIFYLFYSHTGLAQYEGVDDYAI